MTYLVIIFIVFPGIYAYIRGRAFLSIERNDDFARRYFKYQQNTALVFWLSLLAFFALVNFDPNLNAYYYRFLYYTMGLGVFIIYLLVYAGYLAGFSLVDHVIREDRLNLPGRITFNIRLLFLIAWPYILWTLAVFGGPEHYVLRVISLCVIFGLLYFFAPYFWKVLLRAKEITDPLVTGKTAEICARIGIKPIRIYSFSPSGLKFANAFAVAPGLGIKGILISEYARANLSLAEQVAVFAHEIGHLTRTQVFRRSISLALPFFLIVIVKTMYPAGSFLISWGLLVAGLVLTRILVPSQEFEKEADLFASRAVDDPEIVIQGLQKIYHLGILPQRFALGEETKFSHPSLARRIKYIRRQSGKPMPRIEGVRDFEGRGETTKVVFSPEAFAVHHKNGKIETTPYGDIQGMLPQPQKEGCRLTVKYRDRVKLAGFNLIAGIDDLVPLIEIAEYCFSELPKVDEARFRRSYYMTGAMVTLFGLILTFFCGPGLFILGITSLVRRNKRYYLSYAAASAALATAAFFLAPDIGKIVLFCTAVCALVSLLDYAIFRAAAEPSGNSTKIAFYIGVGILAVQTVVIILLRLVHMAPPAIQLYKVLFLNLSVLSVGLIFCGPLREVKRQAVILADFLEILLFIMINIRL